MTFLSSESDAWPDMTTLKCVHVWYN